MMQLHVSGRLVRDPAQKTSANGKSYVQALVTAGSGDGDQLVTLMAFDTDLANLLASLRKGDSLSAIGNGSVRAYSDKEGKPAVGVNVMVSRLMAMATKEAHPDQGQTANPLIGGSTARPMSGSTSQQARETLHPTSRFEIPCHSDRGHRHAQEHTRFEVHRHQATGRGRTIRSGRTPPAAPAPPSG